eukprot:14807-Heterococcus_DN1.PRE.5
MVTYVHITESRGQQAMHRRVPSHWTAEHITRYERFMQFLQQRWNLCAAAAEFAATLMINVRPWKPEVIMHAAAHAVTKQDLLGMANVELVDSSYAEHQAVISVIEVVCWFNGAEHPLTNEPSRAEIVAAFYSVAGNTSSIQQELELSLLNLTGYALESILGTYISGTGSRELVDFEILRLLSMRHWSLEQRSRYEHFMQYLQQQWAVDAATAEVGTELELLTKLQYWPVANPHDVVHAVTKQHLLRCVANQLVEISSAERHAVVHVIELVYWFSGDDHPLSTSPTQEQIEVALECAR